MAEEKMGYYSQLMESYLAGEATEAELQELFDYIRNNPGPASRMLVGLGRTEWERLAMQPQAIDPAISTQMMERLLAARRVTPVIDLDTRPRTQLGWRRLTVAAVLITLLGSGWWLYTGKPEVPVTAGGHRDVLPGGNKAILTLANGQRITLDSVKNGQLAVQGKTTITKLKNGQLVYNALNEKPTEILYNTISTPRGGQYRVVLQDGTQVWLNAASGITYPTAFVGKERKVEVRGEVYFDVARDHSRPFKIVSMAAGANAKRVFEVDVLGTAFNIKDYQEEAGSKMTLIDGAIRVSSGNAGKILRPGQQAVLRDGANLIDIIDEVDTAAAIAWKEGAFNINHETITEVMRQLSRWYDVEFSYGKDLPKDSFTAIISRNNNLSEVLKMLEATGRIHFTIDNKKVTVLP